MAIRSIIIAPDPRLKIECAPVERVDDRLRALMDDLLETMYAEPGIGLAAPQVGARERVIVVDVSRSDEPPRPLKLANPEIAWVSDRLVTYEEGCLSLPDHYADVTRPGAVRVRYLDYHGEAREIEAKEVLATCIQHEIDHLDGVLFVDRISALKRNMILRKLSKAKKAGQAVSA